MFPLVAFALAHGAPDLACAIAFAVAVNVGASIACVAAIRYTVPADYLPPSLTAWPWEVRNIKQLVFLDSPKRGSPC